MLMTLGQLRQLISEATMSVKPPHTPKEKQAMIELVKWVSDRMDVRPSEVQSALEKAKTDDWTEVMDLLSTYYFMKNISEPKRRSN